MEFRWEGATRRDKVALYEVVRSLMKKRSLDWKTFWSKVGIEVGEDYERNFRRGEISGTNAASIFRWLQINFPETAEHLLDVISDAKASLDPNSVWEAFLDEHGEFTNIELAEVKLPRFEDAPRGKFSGTPIRRPTPIQRTIKMYQRFTFRIESPFDGRIWGLQRIGGVWWPIPLAADWLNNWPRIAAGESWLPYDPDDPEKRLAGHLIKEAEEPGLHLMAFVIVQDGDMFRKHFKNIGRSSPDVLDRLASVLKQLPKETWRVYRYNVMVRDLDEA